MKEGDHIYIYLRDKATGVKFTHHGIYIGDNRVIHYWDGKIRRSKIYKDKWLRRSIHIKKYKKCYDSERVIKRAKKRLGEKKYHLIFNNCEHFAYWCKTGKHKSKQVNDKVKIIKIKTPKIKVSEVKIPKIKTPKIKIPKIKTPKIKTPKIKTPKIKLRKIRFF
ncbi:hypothetical protein NIES4101_87220 [Calothrix sp. NIES-4101]|nr:hypothetical protein NIES4101_87220 [Calothrix sp. NIES-4101]